MNQSGKTVFLDLNPKMLAYRLQHSKTERPLIQGKSKNELILFIEEMLQKRRPFYEQAKYRITDPDIDPEELLSLLS